MKQDGWIGDNKSEMDDDGLIMIEGRIIETNRYDGVVFPMSMCVSKLDVRSQNKERNMNEWCG